jgi:hypothetical protein
VLPRLPPTSSAAPPTCPLPIPSSTSSWSATTSRCCSTPASAPCSSSCATWTRPPPAGSASVTSRQTTAADSTSGSASRHRPHRGVWRCRCDLPTSTTSPSAPAGAGARRGLRDRPLPLSADAPGAPLLGRGPAVRGDAASVATAGQRGRGERSQGLKALTVRRAQRTAPLRRYRAASDLAAERPCRWTSAGMLVGSTAR